MIKLKLEFDERTIEELDRRAKEVIDEFMNDVVEEILTEAKYNLLEEGHVVTGKLLGSAYKEKKGELKYEFGFNAPYAGFVEYGTAPRQRLPPVGKLIEWAKIKFGLKYDEAKKVGWAVAHWIKEHGTKPHPYFRSALSKVISKYRDLRIER